MNFFWSAGREAKEAGHAFHLMYTKLQGEYIRDCLLVENRQLGRKRLSLVLHRNTSPIIWPGVKSVGGSPTVDRLGLI